jgi:hypothetical protein
LEKHPRIVAAIQNARKRATGLCRRLAKEGFIELFKNRAEQGKRWQLTERGTTLRGQKALKRIPRARALQYLPKVIDTTTKFNSEEGPNYYIAKLYLFGSLLTGSADVGDVDLIVNVQSRFSRANWEKWRELEKRRLEQIRPSGLRHIAPSTELEAAHRLNRISPYISVVARDSMLEQLTNKGEPYQLIYEYDPISSSINPEALGEAAAGARHVVARLSKCRMG